MKAWKRKNNIKGTPVKIAFAKSVHGKNQVTSFLTLTAPNVPADELNDEIKHYKQSFQRLIQRKEVKQIVKGYARKLEITYNEERDDYHPHFHVLIAVDKNYFNNSWSY